MRIGTTQDQAETITTTTLHPVFGLDEDWNIGSVVVVVMVSALHPVFGLDEDWNSEFVTNA